MYVLYLLTSPSQVFRSRIIRQISTNRIPTSSHFYPSALVPLIHPYRVLHSRSACRLQVIRLCMLCLIVAVVLLRPILSCLVLPCGTEVRLAYVCCMPAASISSKSSISETRSKKHMAGKDRKVFGDKNKQRGTKVKKRTSSSHKSTLSRRTAMHLSSCIRGVSPYAARTCNRKHPRPLLSSHSQS